MKMFISAVASNVSAQKLRGGGKEELPARRRLAIGIYVD
jgi:hypothetical protein